MKKQITVTQAHIDKGKPQKADDCPIFHALTDAGFNVDEVDLWAFIEIYPNEWAYIALPDEATSFIDQFDAGKPVQPFTFELDSTEEVEPDLPEIEDEP
jgi:hypothetical protein